MSEKITYVDIYNLPVPRARLEEYRRQACEFGAALIDHGGLRYREFVLDDAGDGMRVEPEFLLTAAVAEFRSKEHRDSVMAGVLEEPRIKAFTESSDPPADFGRMVYGGFTTLVESGPGASEADHAS